MSDIDRSIEALSPKKRELFEMLLRQRQQERMASQITPIPDRERLTSFPLSFAQQRLWFLHQLTPDSPAYNIAFAWRVSGPLEVAVLEQSLGEILKRHEVLRATFTIVEGTPVQVIASPQPFRLEATNLEPLAMPERLAEAQRLAVEEARTPFDLSRGPLLRVKLLRLGAQDHVVLFTMHHIVSDGWSLGLLLSELASLYNAYCGGAGSPLPPLPIQYADFAQWQRDWLQGEVLESQLAYWKQRLAGLPPAMELPTDRPRPSSPTFRGGTFTFVVPGRLSESLKALGQKRDATLFMTLLAAFQTLLRRYTGQDDVVVGSPIANRGRAEIEGLIGSFVNTLVFRGDLSGNPRFSDLLADVRRVALEAYDHQDLPFEKLVEELRVERDVSRNPVYQVMFNLQNTPAAALELSGLRRSHFEVPEASTSMLDLSLSFSEKADPNLGPEPQLIGQIEYNTDLFDRPTIARMAGHFQTLLQGIVETPEARLLDLPLLGDDEYDQLVARYNDTRADYPADAPWHKRFEAQVSQSPDSVAVISSDQQLTFRELNARANRMAHRLKALGVGPEQVVAVVLNGSLDLLASWIAVFKAGGAYLPIDPATPADRLRFILEDAGVALVIAPDRLAERLPLSSTPVLRPEIDEATGGQDDSTDPASDATPDSLAYIIYTSGSTGRPKGVMVTHRSLVNHNFAIAEKYALRASDRVLQFASPGFDVAAEEIFASLLRGAAVVLRSEALLAPNVESLRWLAEQSLTVLNLPASYWHDLVDGLEHSGSPLLPSLRLVVVGSERVSPEKVASWERVAGRGAAWLNAYGTSEATITSTVYAPADGGADLGLWASVPIGRPIANVRTYILDPRMRPSPGGVPGELHLGGDGVARGYVKRPELTAERFIPDPFSGTPGARLYRTGDVARYLSDGNIEFLGRADDQVKIRGYRIEPGEIEATLARHPEVHECLVAARAVASESLGLAAYVVAAEGAAPLPSELRAYLKERLPEYMVPTWFVQLEAIPLLPNGKVDRRALPEPERRGAEIEAAYVPARNEVEGKIAAIWQEVLRLERVGVHDNFFDLGGHSLLMAEIQNRLGEAFGKEPSMLELFEYPTVGTLAKFYGSDQAERPASQPKANPADKLREGKSRLRQQLRQRQQAAKKK